MKHKIMSCLEEPILKEPTRKRARTSAANTQVELTNTVRDTATFPEKVYEALVLVDFREFIDCCFPEHQKRFYKQLNLYLQEQKEICLIGASPTTDKRYLLDNAPKSMKQALNQAMIFKASYTEIPHLFSRFQEIAIGGCYKDACVALNASLIAQHIESDFELDLQVQAMPEYKQPSRRIPKCVISDAMSLGLMESMGES